MPFRNHLDTALAQRGYALDAAQQKAAARLQQLYQDWIDYKVQRSNALMKLLVRPRCRAACTCGVTSAAARAS